MNNTLKLFNIRNVNLLKFRTSIINVFLKRKRNKGSLGYFFLAICIIQCANLQK